MSELEPGWLEDIIEETERDMSTWPKWMLRELDRRGA